MSPYTETPMQGAERSEGREVSSPSATPVHLWYASRDTPSIYAQSRKRIQLGRELLYYHDLSDPKTAVTAGRSLLCFISKGPHRGRHIFIRALEKVGLQKGPCTGLVGFSSEPLM